MGGEIAPLSVVSFVLYLLVVLGIGVWAARFSSRGIGEFFLAGRGLRRWVVALSAVVSGRSSWLILGVTGLAYVKGIVAVWFVAGYILVELFLFLFYAARLRRFTGATDALTLPDFFESRFTDRRGVLRVVSVALIVVFMIAYVSAQLNAGGKALHSGFGLAPDTGILLTAVIVLGYTVAGGLLAVSLTDVVQAVLMIVALVVVPAIAIADLGGMAAVLEQVGELGIESVDPFALSLGAFVGALGIGLGSPGNPHILVRYMSIDDPRQLRISAVIGTVWNVVMAWGAIYVGLAGRCLYPAAADLPNGDKENIFPALAQLHLHPLLFGLIVAAIFAAIMSTCDSQLLVAASGIVRDVYQKLLRRGREIATARLVRLSRLAVVGLVALAVALCFVIEESIFDKVLSAWAGLGAAFGPTTILALFWRRTTGAGVLAGMVSGAATVFVWKLGLGWGKTVVYELVPAFAAGLLVTVVVSLVTRPPDDAAEHMRLMRVGFGRE
jgi:SSS family solute:Na+ symporter